MAKIKQLTYQVANVENSIAPNVELCDNIIITELGIYGVPGTSFTINKNGTLILNGSGLLSLDHTTQPITSLKLNNSSIPLYQNGTHCLILDIKYEEV